jgi:hypothetical protein
MRHLFQDAQGRKSPLNPTQETSRRREAFARELYSAELHRYHRPHALSRGAQLSFMRRTVKGWDE